MPPLGLYLQLLCPSRFRCRGGRFHKLRNPKEDGQSTRDNPTAYNRQANLLKQIHAYLRDQFFLELLKRGFVHCRF
jgi:hypothetical protein